MQRLGYRSFFGGDFGEGGRPSAPWHGKTLVLTRPWYYQAFSVEFGLPRPMHGVYSIHGAVYREESTRSPSSMIQFYLKSIKCAERVALGIF